MDSKISIITINLNNKNGLYRTIESVLGQSFSPKEFLIIDGESTDGSVEILKQNSASVYFWVSEPDSGIYNAMNKGIQKATGEYCLFLNSGDRLISADVLEKVSTSLKGEEIIYGDGILEKADGSETHFKVPEILTLDYFYFSSLFHPSAFIKRDLFYKYGFYNEANKVISDWEFFLKVLMVHNVSYKHLPYAISVAEDGGISRNVSNTEFIEKECYSVLNSLFPQSVIKLLDDFKKIEGDLDWIKKKPLVPLVFSLRQARKQINTKNLKDIFTQVHRENYWGGEDSLSGPGSDVIQTTIIKNKVSDIIATYKIKSIVDAPCGDFLWMKDVIGSCNDLIETFTGFDIVDELIYENNKSYGTLKIKFEVRDLTNSEIPGSDLIVCRDCFIHLSYSNIYSILSNFSRSKSQYLLLSTYTNGRRFNTEINDKRVNFRPLNMQKFPFMFPDPVEIINEGCTEFCGEYSDKSLALWELKNIPFQRMYFLIKIARIKFHSERILRRVSRILKS
jgi:glycosyltransferase involved in cell wall biosynthesis